MGNRLSRIVTRTGDDGTTGLGDGTRVPKDSARIEAMGDVDELNSALGVLLALELPPAPPTRDWLAQIQQDLFDLGSELAVPGTILIDDERVGRLEQQVESLNATLPPLREFILPGGGRAAAVCHLARTVCRRAERHGWALTRQERSQEPPGQSPPARLRYLNRLSDLLFVLARIYARAEGGAEVLWRHERRKPGSANDTDT
jgi:cob(I)alamin adenosyltransferase